MNGSGNLNSNNSGVVSASASNSDRSNSYISNSYCCSLTKMENVEERLVVVRYFLDRPGYNIQNSNSSARFWKDPPSCCTLSDIKDYLIQQNILDNDKESSSSSSNNSSNNNQHILAEVYLDKFSSYMFLDSSDTVTFDFKASTRDNPTLLDIRLTDLDGVVYNNKSSDTGGGGEASPPSPLFAAAAPTRHCNMSPAGLYAFTMINGLEATSMLIELSSSSAVSPSFNLIYGPYAFFIGGLLQLLVGMWEVTRVRTQAM